MDEEGYPIQDGFETEGLPDWSILEAPNVEPSPLDDLGDCSPDH
jgi:hypothetical protein